MDPSVVTGSFTLGGVVLTYLGTIMIGHRAEHFQREQQYAAAIHAVRTATAERLTPDFALMFRAAQRFHQRLVEPAEGDAEKASDQALWDEARYALVRTNLEYNTEEIVETYRNIQRAYFTWLDDKAESAIRDASLGVIPPELLIQIETSKTTVRQRTDVLGDVMRQHLAELREPVNDTRPSAARTATA